MSIENSSQKIDVLNAHGYVIAVNIVQMIRRASKIINSYKILIHFVSLALSLSVASLFSRPQALPVEVFPKQFLEITFFGLGATLYYIFFPLNMYSFLTFF